MIRIADGVCFIQYGIDGAAEGFAIVDGNAVFAVDGNSQVVVCALTDVFDVPNGIAELFSQGGGKGSDNVGDRAVFFCLPWLQTPLVILIFGIMQWRVDSFEPTLQRTFLSYSR